MFSKLTTGLRLELNAKQTRRFWIFFFCDSLVICSCTWFVAHVGPININVIYAPKTWLIALLYLAVVHAISTLLFMLCSDDNLFYVFCTIYILFAVVMLSLTPTTISYFAVLIAMGGVCSSSLLVVNRITKHNTKAQRLMRYSWFLLSIVLVGLFIIGWIQQSFFA